MHFFKTTLQLFFLFFSIILLADTSNTIPFSNVQIQNNNSITIKGSLLQIGNQLLCYNSSDGATCLEPTIGVANNTYYQNKVRIDTSAGAPLSNSMAKLVFEDGDNVILARLYWSARNDVYTTDAKKIQIKGPQSSTYTEFISPDDKFGWYDSDVIGRDFMYVASADVTQYISTNGAGDYYVGGIVATNGNDKYASWQLIVVVENEKRSLKNIAIYDGYQVLFTDNPFPSEIIVDAGGFITPTSGLPFNANLFIYGGETDSTYGDTSAILNGEGTWINLIDGQNTTNDVMNASVSSPDYIGGYRSNEAGMANPNFKNVLGVDIDKLKINDELDETKQTLSNSQTSTQIKLTSQDNGQGYGDLHSLNMFAFETEVYVPNFCYDYAYSQNGKNFTETNDGSAWPTISGDVNLNDPVQVTIYLKSLVDNNFSIENMIVEVRDINRSQATYINPSTLLATTGEVIPVAVSPTVSTVGDMDYLSNISIGTMQQSEYFYLYYSLDPKVETLNMPIKVKANYNLIINGNTVPYSLTISDEIPMCTTSDFAYTPAKGVFNVVHNNYYTNTSTDLSNPNGDTYYNLPTQVVEREGNFKIISMNPESLDELSPVSTVVAVELIDADAFHTTDASCSEYESAISHRVWIVFENNTTSAMFDKDAIQAAIDSGSTLYPTELASTSDFYKVATENAAFRISYNVAPDSNVSAADNIYIDKESDGTYTMNNWQSTWYGETCAQDMTELGYQFNTVAANCNATGNNPSTLAGCMECVYGIHTRFVCSRDNFSIRPESFLIKVNDQNQTNPSSKVRVADDISGLATPSTYQVNLAAGYQYNLEVNATSHISSNASIGYTKTFNNEAKYTWQPNSTPTGCNDENNSTIAMSFSNGVADVNSSLNQVGEYNLNITDTTWTTVDQTLHTGSYFLAGPDCVANSSLTQAVNSSNLNGCNISSNHDSSGTTLKYRDYNVEFHPYKFDMNGITHSFGENNTSTFATKPFIYMSDISTDNKMSFHLNGDIKVLGYNNAPLNNFVGNCYAKPVVLDLNKTHNTTPIKSAFAYNFHNYDINNTNTSGYPSNDDVNESDIQIDIASTDFTKDLNGSINTSLNLNFKRDLTKAVNPHSITYTNYKAKCKNSSDCTMFADLTTQESKEAQANISQPFTLQHYYGRTNAPRQRFNGSNGNDFIYYEVYCQECDKTLLQDGVSSKYVNDPRWFTNSEHNSTNYGFAGNVTQKYATKVSATIPTNANPAQTTLQYNGSVFPYKATMQNSPNTWLIYNKYNPSTTSNEFEVEFDKTGSSWSGKADTNSTSNTSGAKETNRRIMW